MSTKDSEQWVLMRNQPVRPDRKGRGRTPWTKDQQVWYLVRSTSVRFAKKVCTSESGLTNHINNVHQERQNIFRCCKCGHKYNVFNMYIENLGTHPKNEYRCHECGKQFKDAHLLSLYSLTHIVQCPFCSRTFKDMKLLEDHVNNAHSQALAEENKKCSYCDAAFETVHELQEHSKIHRYFSCEICFAGFVSDVILIEHEIHDHPEGPSQPPQTTSKDPYPQLLV